MDEEVFRYMAALADTCHGCSYIYSKVFAWLEHIVSWAVANIVVCNREHINLLLHYMGLEYSC